MGYRLLRAGCRGGPGRWLALGAQAVAGRVALAAAALAGAD